VLDLGYGAYTRLSSRLNGNISAVSAVVVSHCHPDHLVDVHALHRALYFSGADRRVPLYAPASIVPPLEALDPEEPSPLSTTFQLIALPGTGAMSLDGWELTSVRTPHYVENVAVRLDGPAGSIVYTGDTGPCSELTSLAAGCDLLICEATDRYQRDPMRSGDGLLMTGHDAGVLAAEAEVRHLMLTHFWPGNDRDLTAASARRSYAGPITLADEHQPGLQI
jgi:ribonuclease BN (tRNA processing enzyme)